MVFLQCCIFCDMTIYSACAHPCTHTGTHTQEYTTYNLQSEHKLKEYEQGPKQWKRNRRKHGKSSFGKKKYYKSGLEWLGFLSERKGMWRGWRWKRHKNQQLKVWCGESGGWEYLPPPLCRSESYGSSTSPAQVSIMFRYGQVFLIHCTTSMEYSFHLHWADQA